MKNKEKNQISIERIMDDFDGGKLFIFNVNDKLVSIDFYKNRTFGGLSSHHKIPFNEKKALRNDMITSIKHSGYLYV